MKKTIEFYKTSQPPPAVENGESDYVFAYELNTESWGEAWYDHKKGKWFFCDDWHDDCCGVSRWTQIPRP